MAWRDVQIPYRRRIITTKDRTVFESWALKKAEIQLPGGWGGGELLVETDEMKVEDEMKRENDEGMLKQLKVVQIGFRQRA
jgi:hypothetical protein